MCIRIDIIWYVCINKYKIRFLHLSTLMAHKLSMDAVHSRISRDTQISQSIQPKRQEPEERKIIKSRAYIHLIMKAYKVQFQEYLISCMNCKGNVEPHYPFLTSYQMVWVLNFYEKIYFLNSKTLFICYFLLYICALNSFVKLWNIQAKSPESSFDVLLGVFLTDPPLNGWRKLEK